MYHIISVVEVHGRINPDNNTEKFLFAIIFWCTWVKNFGPSTLPGKKMENKGKYNKSNVLLSFWQ